MWCCIFGKKLREVLPRCAKPCHDQPSTFVTLPSPIHTPTPINICTKKVKSKNTSLKKKKNSACLTPGRNVNNGDSDDGGDDGGGDLDDGSGDGGSEGDGGGGGKGDGGGDSAEGGNGDDGDDDDDDDDDDGDGDDKKIGGGPKGKGAKSILRPFSVANGRRQFCALFSEGGCQKS